VGAATAQLIDVNSSAGDSPAMIRIRFSPTPRVICWRKGVWSKLLLCSRKVILINFKRQHPIPSLDTRESFKDVKLHHHHCHYHLSGPRHAEADKEKSYVKV